MRNYSIVISLLIMLYSCESNADIFVKKAVEKSMDSYNTATVYVKHDNYKSSNGFRSGSEEIIVARQISDALEEFGINTTYDENGAHLKVECHLLHGWGIPRFMRHFKISAKYITFINIKFIDLSSNKVIGEVEYNKPFFQINQGGIISTLIMKLIQSYQPDDK